MKYFINFLKAFIIGVVIVCGCLGVKFKYKSDKELHKLTVKNSDIITITSTFDISQPEYIKRVLKNITVTSYNNHENQTDNTPNITATNRPVREGIVAVSRDLIKNGLIHYGDLVYIDCFEKWFIAEDTMNQRFEKRLDVFLFDKKESLKINKKCNIEILHYTR